MLKQEILISIEDNTDFKCVDMLDGAVSAVQDLLLLFLALNL